MKGFKSFLLTLMTCVSVCWGSIPWTMNDMLEIRHLMDVELSPDHTEVLYTATTTLLEENRFVTGIYKSSTQGGPTDILLTQTGSCDMQGTWSPDGTRIAFISDRSGKRNLFLMNKDGQNVIQLTNENEDIQTYKWSPDGHSIAFVMSESLPASDDPKISYVVGVERKINRLWIISSSGGTPRALTNDDYFVRGAGGWGTTTAEFDWSPDSSKIAFSYTKKSGFEPFFLEGTIGVVDVASGYVYSLPKHAQSETVPHFSPDGQSIAYLESEPESTYIFYRRVVVCDVDGSNRRLLAPTFDEGPYLMGKNLLGWTVDGQNLLYVEPRGMRFRLYSLPADGSAPTEWDSTDLLYHNICISKDGAFAAFVGESSNIPPEVYFAKFEDGSLERISHLNGNLSQFPKIRTEIVKWKARDGKEIEGILNYPLNYQEGKSYPLLLEVHGGPMAFFTQSYIGSAVMYPTPLFSQNGYFVLRANPRGSCGYGKQFREANLGDIGGEDFQDLMAGIDFLIARGQVDGNRLGIMGWSYGGYMSAWAVTQTNRFKAASIGAALTNLVSMAGTMDCKKFISGLLLTKFWENLDLYIERSPLHHILNVETPCLIMHGAADIRVPVTQGVEFYYALKMLEKPAKMVIYPGMDHSPSSPKQFLNIMENNLDWFDRYIAR